MGKGFAGILKEDTEHHKGNEKPTMRHYFTLPSMTIITIIEETVTSVAMIQKLEPSSIASGSIKCCSHFGNQSGSSSKC